MAPVVLLVLALLLAQTLGFVHRIAHGSLGSKAVASAVAQERSEARVAKLFQHSEDDATCRLFDQCSSFDALNGVPAVVLPMVLPTFVLLFFEGEFLARWVALFDARGPPSVR